MATVSHILNGGPIAAGSLDTVAGELEVIHVQTATAFSADIAGDSTLIVNVGDLPDRWVGGFTVENGGTGVVSYGVFQNTNSLVQAGGTFDVSTSVTGQGTFTNNGGFLHFTSNGDADSGIAAGVDAHQTVVTQNGGTTQYNIPATDHGSNLLDFGEIVLQNVNAVSYDLVGGKLSLFSSAGAVVDTMRLATGAGASDFGVSKVGGSTVVHADGAFSQGAALPVHS